MQTKSTPVRRRAATKEKSEGDNCFVSFSCSSGNGDVMTVKHKTFSAVRWTALSAVAQASLQLAQVAVLARLLAPGDFGLMAMVAVVLGYASLFSDFGVNIAFVQKQDVSDEQRSSLFWLNVLISIGITIFVVSISPMAADYFGDARLTPLLMLSASTFVLSALGSQIKVALSKELDFRPLVMLEISVAILGFTMSAFGALAGWGVYALVISGIATATVSTLLTWGFLSRGWRPMWRFRLSDTKPFLGFGGALVADNLVTRVNTTIDIILGGRFLVAGQLGLYSLPRNLALQVQMMVNPIITRVGFPLIAKLQHDVERVRSIYLKTINMTASTNAPVYIGIAVFAPEIVAILLGPKWVSSGELLRIFALWGGIRSLSNPVGSLVQGMGRADLALKWNFSLLFITIPTIWLGSQYGAKGLAWALFAIPCVTFIPRWYVMVRLLCHAGFWEYTVSGFKPFLLAGIAFIPAYLAAMEFDLPIIRLALGILLALPVYLFLSHKFNPAWFIAMQELLWKKILVQKPVESLV